MFGDYLVERGLLSEENLRRALEHQETLSPALGRIGYERGMMTLDQVIEVLEAQREVGLRFGEVAVARGVIDESQLSELLAVQHDSHLPLGQVLATLGLIDPIVLDRELKAYLAQVKQESDASLSAADAPRSPSSAAERPG